jgi:hypothetical protein
MNILAGFKLSVYNISYVSRIVMKNGEKSYSVLFFIIKTILIKMSFSYLQQDSLCTFARVVLQVLSRKLIFIMKTTNKLHIEYFTIIDQ